MKKLILPFLTCALLLCACGNNKQENTAEETSSDTISVADTSAAEKSEEQETAVAEETTEVTEATIPQIENPDIRNLKWGMSIDEVKQYEDSEFFKEEVEEGSSGNIQTLLTYRNVSFDDYTAKMVLCIGDGVGLNGVNYYIACNDISDAYTKFYDSFVSDYGEPTSAVLKNMVSWDIPSIKQSILLVKSDSSVEVHFFPYSGGNSDSTSDAAEPISAKTNDVVVVELTDKSIKYKDTENWVFSDYVLFTFKINNNSSKDIKGVSGVATFNDMFGKEIIKVNCDFTDGVAANSYAIDDSLSLEVNQFIDSHVKLMNTPYEDIIFSYDIKKIVYSDGTIDER